jgi:allantoicase
LLKRPISLKLRCALRFTISSPGSLTSLQPAVSHKGTFKSTGAIFDGWETRRHNSGHDWCIIRLGAPSGYIVGFDIDTAHFSGNEAPAASVQALFAEAREKPQADDARVSNQSAYSGGIATELAHAT